MSKLLEWFKPKTLSRSGTRLKSTELSRELKREPHHVLPGETPQAYERRMAAKKKTMKKEELEPMNESVKTTHENPLVTVHDKDGHLHTHANLSVANGIFGTNVKHTDVHKGPVKAKNREGDNLTFAVSMHHAKAVEDEEKFKKQYGEEVEQVVLRSFRSFAEEAVHPMAVHVSHVGGGKYKVHAVGKKLADGIKVGEHLNDTHLDDIQDMGGKIKEVKPKPAKE